MIGLMQRTIPWSSAKGSAKAARTPKPTASEILSEDHLQILNGKKPISKGRIYSLFTLSFQVFYFPSKYHVITA